MLSACDILGVSTEVLEGRLLKNFGTLQSRWQSESQGEDGPSMRVRCEAAAEATRGRRQTTREESHSSVSEMENMQLASPRDPLVAMSDVQLVATIGLIEKVKLSEMLVCLGKRFMQKMRFEEAAAQFERALVLIRLRDGPHHQDARTVALLLAEAYAQEVDDEEADRQITAAQVLGSARRTPLSRSYEQPNASVRRSSADTTPARMLASRRHSVQLVIDEGALSASARTRRLRPATAVPRQQVSSDKVKAMSPSLYTGRPKSAYLLRPSAVEISCKNLSEVVTYQRPQSAAQSRMLLPLPPLRPL